MTDEKKVSKLSKLLDWAATLVLSHGVTVVTTPREVLRDTPEQTRARFKPEGE